ncbi:carboxymuconolactone decarboxylase family protein [Geodermatophilus sp. CPCC 205506]|uniref:carboxymuconolactone decarboxylase family protein n=1 Tax=Geodermatophilus sp. CPCC 205506 TaxID=2936596 RepID=UPI003EEDC2E9
MLAEPLLPPWPGQTTKGTTEQELIESITHLVFYAGWPTAFSAIAVAKRVFRGT